MDNRPVTNFSGYIGAHPEVTMLPSGAVKISFSVATNYTTMDSQTGEVVAGPDVISRGFVYVRESENLMDDVKSVVRHEVAKCEERGIRDWTTIKSTIKENLRDYLFIKTKRNPMIIPIIMEV